MATIRDRTREWRFAWTGSWTRFGATHYVTRLRGGPYEHCQDVVGNPKGVNPFRLTRRIDSIALLDGYHNNDPTSTYHVDELPIGLFTEPDVTTPLNNANSLDWAWKLQAKASPSASNVSMPTFIAELKDFPSLFKDWGGNLLRKAAKSNIELRWAIRPLISDIKRLTRFVEDSTRRVKWLKKLRDGGYLRRKVQLGQDRWIDNEVKNQFLNSLPVTVKGRYRDTHFEKVWGTVKYKLNSDSLVRDMDDSELHKFANYLTLGYTLHEAPTTAWELLPWSWLVDWFSNIGDMVSASNNAINGFAYDHCIMRYGTHTRTYVIESHPYWITPSSKEYQCRIEVKERHPVPFLLPLFSVQLPVITNGQWSILASLAALRR